MSLNGLDAPVLTEAFGRACAEPGSWYVIYWHLFVMVTKSKFQSFMGALQLIPHQELWLTRSGHLRFWIKYVSRDDVELLCQGTNGTEEMREAAAKEPDDSPLYGFIRFRRRNILVKYVPEDTSRVLKGKL